MNKLLKFTVNDYSVEENPNSHFAILDMKIVSDGMNLHKLPIEKGAIEKSAPSLYGKPVLVDYLEDGTFGGHSNEEIPCGVFLDKNVTISEEGGKTWMSARAFVWKKYFSHVMDVFKKDNGKSDISMEIEVVDSGFKIDGFEWIKQFNFLGVTIIGQQPAITGANATVMQFSALKQKAIDEFSNKYSEVDFTIPSGVKKWCEKGLGFSKGGHPVSLAVARHLVKSEQAEPKKIEQMRKYFSKNENFDFTDNDNPDDKSVAYMLYGSHAGKKWSNDVWMSMQEANKKINSFFTVEDNVEFGIPKNEWGTGDAIEVDKKSLSSTSWGSVNKSELMSKILKASNYKSLVKDVYMLVEAGWEDAPSEHLKYPVMQISGNKLVYNKGGLSSALGYANKENESGVVSKVESIQNKLDPNNDKEDKKDMKNEKEVKASAPPPEEDGEKEDKAEKVSEEKKEEEKEPKGVGDSPEEEKKETPEEEKKEEMSLDAYADVPAFLSMLEAETEEHRAMVNMFSAKKIEAPKMYSAFYALAKKFCDMKMEYESLKKFKADKEEEEFALKVDASLKDVYAFLPKEEVEQQKEGSKEFTLATFSVWETALKAKAFEVSKNIKREESKEESHMRLPFGNLVADKSNKKSLWN